MHMERRSPRDYGYDLLQQSKKDLDFMLQQFLITPNT